MMSINDKYRDILLNVFSSYIKDLSNEIYEDAIGTVIESLTYPSLEGPSLDAILSFYKGMVGSVSISDPKCYNEMIKQNSELIRLLEERKDKNGSSIQ